MKQFKAITVDGEMALKRLPEMKRPIEAKFQYKCEYNDATDEYEQHLAEIKSEHIKVAPEYKGFWKEGDVVREDEFKLCVKVANVNELLGKNATGKEKVKYTESFAIPKPKEDKGELLVSPEIADKLLKIRDALIQNDYDEAYHWLYLIACPEMDKNAEEVWSALENKASQFSITKKTKSP